MGNPILKPQAVSIPLLVALAVVGIVRLWHAEGRQEIAKPVVYRYHVSLVTEQAAKEGKVIRATGPNRETQEHRCQPDDAAIAFLWVTNSAGDTYSDLMLGAATDSAGQHYSARLEHHGHFHVVRILRGFPKTPASISVPIFDRDSGQSPPQPLYTLNFTKIAEAHREISPPSASEARSIGRHVIAEDGPDGIRVKVLDKPAPNEFYWATVVATSYCPARQFGYLAPQSSSFLPDAVKVQIHHTRTIQKEEAVVYRNAEFRTVSGYRVLFLPTDQQVGTLQGSPLMAKKTLDFAGRNVRLSHPQGQINLVRELRNQLSTSAPIPMFKCVSVSPSPEALGLDWLQINVDSLGSSDLFKAKAAERNDLPNRVPELTMIFHSSASVDLDSRTVVLPLHHKPASLKPLPGPQAAVRPAADSEPKMVAD